MWYLHCILYCDRYESNENMTITCSTKVCSFGKQVVEKVETEYARFENGRFVYRISRSPMCEYMINFIHKLKHLPEKYMMNSVLENFTILQVRWWHYRHVNLYSIYIFFISLNWYLKPFILSHLMVVSFNRSFIYIFIYSLFLSPIARTSKYAHESY